MIWHESPPKQTHPHDYGYRKCNSLSLVVESKPRTLLLFMPLFTVVRGIGILRTSPFGDSPKFVRFSLHIAILATHFVSLGRRVLYSEL
jgi:hypothetical protein